MEYQFAGLRIDWKAMCWLVVGFLGAMVFLGMRARGYDAMVVGLWALMGVLHWAGGFYLHVIEHKHIEVIDQTAWTGRGLEMRFTWLCRWMSFASFAYLAGIYRFNAQVSWPAVVVFYIFATWWFAYTNHLAKQNRSRS